MKPAKMDRQPIAKVLAERFPPPPPSRRVQAARATETSETPAPEMEKEDNAPAQLCVSPCQSYHCVLPEFQLLAYFPPGAITDSRGAFGRLERPWLRVLAGWEQLHRQHDAAEFISFDLGKSEPEACRGGWQSRLQEDGSNLVVDSGSCFAPLAIEVTGRSLQHCIYQWHLQHRIQALSSAPQLMFIQLKRFRDTIAGPGFGRPDA